MIGSIDACHVALASHAVEVEVEAGVSLHLLRHLHGPSCYGYGLEAWKRPPRITGA